MRKCEVCGIDISDRKETAKTCSEKCRKDLSRLASVTPNVTLGDNSVTLEFKFRTSYARKPGTPGYDEDAEESRKTLRTARYWYEVPLNAVPVLEKDWPKIPVFPAVGEQPETRMNARQYFLWWKNDFKVDKGGDPIIHNPFPPTVGATYVAAGEGSRHWGTV